MTEAIVYSLEVIEIDQSDCQRLAGLPRMSERRDCAADYCAPVWQPC